MKLRLMICAAAAGTALFAGEDATSATYAVMNVTNAYTDTVIAVPWMGLDGSTISISNLVNTTTLSRNDKLYTYEEGTWFALAKNAAGGWEGFTTVKADGTIISSADGKTASRGTGLILQRGSAGGTVLLCGRVGTNDVTTTIAASGKTLFANPTASVVELNEKFVSGASCGDTIIIPQNNGKSAIYTFDGKEWGSTNKVVTGTYQLGNKTYNTYANEWVRGGEIQAGTGAWYESKASDAHTITW